MCNVYGVCMNKMRYLLVDDGTFTGNANVFTQVNMKQFSFYAMGTHISIILLFCIVWHLLPSSFIFVSRSPNTYHTHTLTLTHTHTHALTLMSIVWARRKPDTRSHVHTHACKLYSILVGSHTLCCHFSLWSATVIIVCIITTHDQFPSKTNHTIHTPNELRKKKKKYERTK